MMIDDYTPAYIANTQVNMLNIIIHIYLNIIIYTIYRPIDILKPNLNAF